MDVALQCVGLIIAEWTGDKGSRRAVERRNRQSRVLGMLEMHNDRESTDCRGGRATGRGLCILPF